MRDCVASESALSLRDSCIHCANSKVKCNKEKPVCSRCVRRRLVCEYKVSRRTGRTSRAVNPVSGVATATRTTETSTTPPTLHLPGPCINATSSILSTTLITSCPQQTSLLTPITTLPVSQSSPEHCMPQTPDLWRSLLSSSPFNADVGRLSSFIPIGTDVGDMFSTATESPQFDSCDIDSLPAQSLGDSVSAIEHPPFPTPAPSDTNVAGPGGTTSSHLTCCLTTILDIFKGLFPNAPATCQRPSGQQHPDKARMIETVVSENKQIIDIINSVLGCPCSHDGYVISLVSLSVLKIMDCHIAAARDRIPVADDNMGWGRDVPACTGRGSPSTFHQVVRSPAVVGRFCIYGRNQNHMPAQLVVTELHRVQRLANVLSSRLESIRLSTCLSSPSALGSKISTDTIDNSFSAAIRPSPLSGSTFLQLEKDLRQRLRAISSETMERVHRA
ncbi:aflatoxin regulatory protein-domain-containing protein [Aspergillus aurantiobrunneus]